MNSSIKWNIFTVVVTMLMVMFCFSSPVSAQAVPDKPVPVFLKSGTPAARALANASTCEEQRDALEKLADQHYADLERVLKDCYGTSYDDWKRCEGCNKSKPKKKYTVVVECMTPAEKQGNACVCTGGPLFTDEAGVAHGKPVLVKTKGSKPWFQTWTCAYKSDDLEAYAAEMRNIHERLCVADSVPFLNRTVDELEADGTDVSGLHRIEGGPICAQTGKHIMEVVKWMSKLRLNRNDVPPFDRDAWEDAYKLLHRLETGYQDLAGGLSEICRPKSSKEPMAVACKRFMERLGVELEAIHKRNDKQDELLADHEARITAVEQKVDEVQNQVDDLSVGEWKLGVGASYLGRLGENVPQSGPGVVAIFGYRSFYGANASSGWSADVRMGYARSTNEDDGDAVGHYTFGGKGAYLYALNDERTTLLSVGVGVNAEVVEEGSNAVNVLPQLGLDFCPGKVFCAGLYAGFGASYTTQEYMDRSDRSGELKPVPAWTLGLDLTFPFGGRDHGKRVREVEEEPAPSRSSTVRRFDERSETRSVDTSVPYDKGYRE